MKHHRTQHALLVVGAGALLALSACDQRAEANAPPPPPRPTRSKHGEPAPKAARPERPASERALQPGPPALVVFGGGWGPEGTQASIEAHVEALARALAAKKPRLLFAAGDAKLREVQVPARTADEAGELLGLVFDRLDNVDVDYRPSKLSGTDRRAASRDGLIDALIATKDDPHGTVVLGVGHGAAATADVPAALELWGPDDRMPVDELARHLDGQARRAPTAFVLGQCHSGAFVDLMFEEGDAKGDVAAPVRCVLAAVPAEREAAGCTPDLGDPDARSYMAMIAEAFTRPQDADLDHDGKLSLAEAHAYARLRDRTVDLPVTTSETWLGDTLGDKQPKLATIALPKLLERARASERVVIEGLAPPGGLDKDAAKRGDAELTAMNEKLRLLDDELADLEADRDRVRRRILDVVLTRWPELASPYHAVSRRLLAGDAKEVVELIKSRKELGELTERDLSIRAKDREKLELEKKKARLERWLRAVTTVASEDALRRSGNKAAIAVLDALLACEALVP